MNDTEENVKINKKTKKNKLILIIDRNVNLYLWYLNIFMINIYTCQVNDVEMHNAWNASNVTDD